MQLTPLEPEPVGRNALHVTNGGVNPVLTILALAYRVSRRVAESRRADGE